MSGSIPEFSPRYDFLFHCCSAVERRDYRGALETLKRGLRRNVEASGEGGEEGAESERNMLAAVRFLEDGLRAAHGREWGRQAKAPGASEASAEKRCSFCGKAEGEAGKVISGPGVHICEGCVTVCNEILRGEAAG